jgi:hypothetical protein
MTKVGSSPTPEEFSQVDVTKQRKFFEKGPAKAAQAAQPTKQKTGNVARKSIAPNPQNVGASPRKSIIEKPPDNLPKGASKVQEAVTAPLNLRRPPLPPVEEAVKYLLDAITKKLEMPKSQNTDALAKDFHNAISAKLLTTDKKLTLEDEKTFELSLLNAIAGALQVQPLTLPATMPELQLPKGQEKEFVMELVQVITKGLGKPFSKLVWGKLRGDFPMVIAEQLGVTLLESAKGKQKFANTPENFEIVLASQLISHDCPLKSIQALKTFITPESWNKSAYLLLPLYNVLFDSEGGAKKIVDQKNFNKVLLPIMSQVLSHSEYSECRFFCSIYINEYQRGVYRKEVNDLFDAYGSQVGILWLQNLMIDALAKMIDALAENFPDYNPEPAQHKEVSSKPKPPEKPPTSKELRQQQPSNPGNIGDGKKSDSEEWNEH